MSGQQGYCGLTVEIQINGAVDRENVLFLPRNAGRNAIEKSTRHTSEYLPYTGIGSDLGNRSHLPENLAHIQILGDYFSMQRRRIKP